MRNFVFGSGGHARVIASVLDVDVVFLVESDPTVGQMLQSDFFLRIDDFKKENIYIGIGSNAVRRKIYGQLLSYGIKPSNCVSKHSFVARNAELGAGVTILPGSVIGAKAIVADNTIVNTLSSVDHDCVLGTHSQVTAGVTFGGTVITGENCFFGLKSTVIPNRTIGNNVVVMAGSLITNDVPDDVTMGGVPARMVKMGV
jgi:UDP-perosamine 4-acetyltransferase